MTIKLMISTGIIGVCIGALGVSSRYNNAVLPHPRPSAPDPATLDGKVMFGYQGWQATPKDGSGNDNWRHWFGGGNPDSAHADFDVWPQMKEYPDEVLQSTAMKYKDGRAARLYSAYQYGTVDLHFKWLRDYDLDGVFEQRFISDIRRPGAKKHFNQVVSNVKRASEKYKRVYSIMYDISGAGASWKKTLLSDWKFLVDSLKIAEGSSYLHHKGRPLLAIWGMGFDHNRFASAEQCDSLLDWFHKNAPKKYRATIMGGINDNWRSHDANWNRVYKKMDVISPWAVGRYRNKEGADAFKKRAIVPDKEYCDENQIDYMPVIFPGFSWYNLRHGKSPFNQIPRQGGEFYWRQSYNAIEAGAKMVYVAMYDEVDEGTAMYKLAQNAEEKPVHARFISADQDGYDLPSDWYLNLARATSQILKGRQVNRVHMPFKLPEKH